MYLSRAELDATRRNTTIALASPQKFHGAVESAFPGGRRRRLWRLDTLNGKLYLLLLSEDVPDLTGLCAQFGKDLSAVGFAVGIMRVLRALEAEEAKKC